MCIEKIGIYAGNHILQTDDYDLIRTLSTTSGIPATIRERANGFITTYLADVETKLNLWLEQKKSASAVV